MNWDDATQLTRFSELSKSINWKETAVSKEAVQLIFIHGGRAIHPDRKELFEKTTGQPMRHLLQVRLMEKHHFCHSPPHLHSAFSLSLLHTSQSDVAFYHELLLGKYLKLNFELMTESYPIADTADIPSFYRQSGLWSWGAGMRELDNHRLATLAVWKRKPMRALKKLKPS
jgi:hypothetical protein